MIKRHPPGCFSHAKIWIHSLVGESIRLITGRSQVQVLLYPVIKNKPDWKVVKWQVMKT